MFCPFGCVLLTISSSKTCRFPEHSASRSYNSRFEPMPLFVLIYLLTGSCVSNVCFNTSASSIPMLSEKMESVWKQYQSPGLQGQTLAASQIRRIALMKRPARLLFPADALVGVIHRRFLHVLFTRKRKAHVAFQWKSTAGALSECVNAWWSRKFNFARKTCFSDFAPHFSKYRFHLAVRNMKFSKKEVAKLVKCLSSFSFTFGSVFVIAFGFGTCCFFRLFRFVQERHGGF